MNRQQAVELLHQRHPGLIDKPEGEVDYGVLHLETFWLQGHAWDLMERRAERRLRRCLTTLNRLLVEGDREVLSALFDSCLMHLIFNPQIEWAKGIMPPRLREAIEKTREEADAFSARFGLGPEA